MSIPTAGAAATSAPTTPSAPATPATPAATPTAPAKAARKTSAELVAEINGTAKPVVAAPAAQPSTEAAVQAATTALDAAGVEVPTQKPGETKVEYAHKLAQLQQRAERADAEVIRHKKTADLTTAELKTLKAQLEAMKVDPVKALAHAGYDPIKFAEAMRDQKITATPAAPVAELPPEVLELVEQGKAAKAEREAKEAEVAAQAEYDRKLGLVKAPLASPEFVAAYPLIAAQPDHDHRILAIIESDLAKGLPEPSLKAVAERYQAAIKSELSALLKSPAVLQALKSDPELAGFFASSVPAAPADPAEPSTETPAEPTASTTPTLTSKVTSSVPSRSTTPRTSAEIAAELRKLQGL